jgi:hypothetical protein
MPCVVSYKHMGGRRFGPVLIRQRPLRGVKRAPLRLRRRRRGNKALGFSGPGVSFKVLREKELAALATLGKADLYDKELSDKPVRAYNLSIGLCTPRPPQLRTWV